LKYGGDVNDHKGRTPLHFIANADYDKYSHNSDSMKLLLALAENGSNVSVCVSNAKDYEGQTPLHLISNIKSNLEID
jgi:ankyrin repeat protein